jgi:transcriptional regulator with XRE-family HTH domain
MTTEPQVQVSPSAGERIRVLRQGHRWTVQAAAGKANVPAEVWAAFEAGRDVGADDYRAILGLFGFTEHSMQFIERAVRGGR